MRCFISINLPEGVGSEIEKLEKNIAESGNIGGKFTEPKKAHLTLKFLGEIDEKKADEVKRVLEQIKFKPFEISVKGLGAFPSENFVKVLWLGIKDGYGDIVKLHREINRKLPKIGFKKEKRFVPHITIGRIKFVKDKEKLKRLFENKEEKEFAKFWCDKICLMKSKLTPKGAIYSEV